MWGRWGRAGRGGCSSWAWKWASQHSCHLQVATSAAALIWVDCKPIHWSAIGGGTPPSLKTSHFLRNVVGLMCNFYFGCSPAHVVVVERDGLAWAWRWHTLLGIPRIWAARGRSGTVTPRPGHGALPPSHVQCSTTRVGDFPDLGCATRAGDYPALGCAVARRIPRFNIFINLNTFWSTLTF